MTAGEPLRPVDLSNWMFEFRHDSLHDRMTGTTQPIERLLFPTGLELLRYLASGKEDNSSRIQNCIHARLRGDPVVAEWKKRRTLFRDAPHFSRYRRSDYKSYDLAAQALFKGCATPDQQSLAQGLLSEIENSSLTVPATQVLFHGRRTDDLCDADAYPCFISTSLDPVVARNHARKAFPDRSFVYMLHLAEDIPGFWGQAGQSKEWEVLLPPGLKVSEIARYSDLAFEIIEARVSR